MMRCSSTTCTRSARSAPRGLCSSVSVRNTAVEHLQDGRGVGVDPGEHIVYVADGTTDLVDVFAAVVRARCHDGRRVERAADERDAERHGQPGWGAVHLDAVFEYGTDTSYGQSAPCVPAAGIPRTQANTRSARPQRACRRARPIISARRRERERRQPWGPTRRPPRRRRRRSKAQQREPDGSLGGSGRQGQPERVDTPTASNRARAPRMARACQSPTATSAQARAT